MEHMPRPGIYSGLSEVQLLRYREPKPGIFIMKSPKVIERALNMDGILNSCGGSKCSSILGTW